MRINMKRIISKLILKYFSTEKEQLEKQAIINQHEFLRDLVDNMYKWKKKGEEDFSKAYQVLINKFTTLEDE